MLRATALTSDGAIVSKKTAYKTIYVTEIMKHLIDKPPSWGRSRRKRHWDENKTHITAGSGPIKHLPELKKRPLKLEV